MLPHISYIYDPTRTYDLTRTYNLPIFLSSYLSIFISSYLPILLSSYLPYDMAPCRSNSVYLYLYGLLWPCTNYPAFRLWNLCTVPGVTPTFSNYHNNCWKTKLIYISHWKMKTDTIIGWIQVPRGVTQRNIKIFQWKSLLRGLYDNIKWGKQRRHGSWWTQKRLILWRKSIGKW